MLTNEQRLLGRGSLIETQALDLFTRRIQLRRGYTVSATIDDIDLPYHIAGNGVIDHGFCFDPGCHDRYFRDAVVSDDTKPNKCRCDMPKARVIHMDRIRAVRDVELAKLDVPFLSAVEAGVVVEQQLIAAEKQTLRDIPQTFKLRTAKTPAQLKALWPPELPLSSRGRQRVAIASYARHEISSHWIPRHFQGLGESCPEQLNRHIRNGQCRLRRHARLSSVPKKQL